MTGAKKEKQLIFIDDSGDPGIGNSPSKYLVMAAVVISDAETAENISRAIGDYRKNRGWKDEYEFKFRKVRKDIIAELLTKIYEHDFQVHAVYINKEDFQLLFSPAMQEKLYNWAIKELLKSIPIHNAKVKIDGRANRKYALRSIAYLMKELDQDHLVKIDIKYADSVKNNLIQLADMVAGSINRHLQPKKAEPDRCYKIIKPKIAKIIQLKPNKK